MIYIQSERYRSSLRKGDISTERFMELVGQTKLIVTNQDDHIFFLACNVLFCIVLLYYFVVS